MNALHSLILLSVACCGVLRAQAQPEPYRVQASPTEASFFEINTIRDSVDGPSRSFCGFQTPSGSDSLFEFGWFYRVVGDTSNSAFNDDPGSVQVLSTPPTYDFGPPVANLNNGSMAVDWVNVDGRGFHANWNVAVEQRGLDQARAVHTFTIQNPGPPGLSIELILFLDADVDGAFADRDLRPAFGGRFSIEDANTNSFLAVDAIPSPEGYEADTFGGGLDTRIFDDQVAYDLANTGIPFGPGDFVGAMQWSLDVPAFGTSEVVVTLGRNVCANPGGFVGSSTNFGVSLSGNFGAPRIASDVPHVGIPFEILVGNGPGNGVATLLLGSTTIVGGALCGVTLLVDPFITLDLPLDPVGSGSLTLRTPCDPAINGNSVFGQVFAIDFSSPSPCFPLVHSDGLQVTFGD